MQRLTSVGDIEGVESVEAAEAYEIRLEARLEAVLSAVSKALIHEYCVVVVAAKWSRAALLFVAATARLSKWPPN